MRIFLLISLIIYLNSVFAQDSLEEFNTRLPGRWDWTKTEIFDRGGSGVMDTTSCHCTKYIIFKPDNRIEYFENNILVNSSSYTINNYYFMNDPVKVIIHGKKITGQIVMKGNIFVVGQFGGCGAINYYKKRE